MIFEQPVNIYSQDYVLKRFQANETAVQVVRGKISALISESEIIELQNSKTTMYSKLGSVEMDVSGLHGQFTDISSKYDAVSGQYTALDAKVGEYKASVDGFSANLSAVKSDLSNNYSTTTAMNAAIKASVDGLSSTVSQTYATGADVQAKLTAADSTAKGYADAAQKAAVNAANTNTNDLLKSYATVKAMNSAIDQKAGSITSTVSSTYATKEALKSTDGKVSSLETWKADAETKITADAIVSTVTDSESWKTVTGLESWKAEASQKITASAIVSTVTSSTSWSKKADKASLISQINQSAESVSISASKINLNGVVTANSYFKILTTGAMECISGHIGGWNIGSTTLKSAADTITLDAANSKITTAISSNGYGTTITPGCIDTGNITAYYVASDTGQLGADGTTLAYIRVRSPFDDDGKYSGGVELVGLGTAPSGAKLVFSSDGTTLAKLAPSSRRYKNHVRDMSNNDVENLYKIPTVFFVYKPGYLEKDSVVPIPGLYAEDVEQYLPLAARYQNGLIEDWNERAVIPYLIKAIQLQHEEIETLKRKVA